MIRVNLATLCICSLFGLGVINYVFYDFPDFLWFVGLFNITFSYIVILFLVNHYLNLKKTQKTNEEDINTDERRLSAR